MDLEHVEVMSKSIAQVKCSDCIMSGMAMLILLIQCPSQHSDQATTKNHPNTALAAVTSKPLRACSAQSKIE